MLFLRSLASGSLSLRWLALDGTAVSTMSRTVFINDTKSNKLFRHATAAVSDGRCWLGGVAPHASYSIMRNRFFSRQTSAEIVVGDLVFLKQGERSPADIVVLCSASNLADATSDSDDGVGTSASSSIDSAASRASNRAFFWINSSFVDGSPRLQLQHAIAQEELEAVVLEIRAATRAASARRQRAASSGGASAQTQSFIVPPTPSGISARDAWLVEWIQSLSLVQGELDCDQPAVDITAFDGKLTLRLPFPTLESRRRNPHRTRTRHRPSAHAGVVDPLDGCGSSTTTSAPTDSAKTSNSMADSELSGNEGHAAATTTTATTTTTTATTDAYGGDDTNVVVDDAPIDSHHHHDDDDDDDDGDTSDGDDTVLNKLVSIREFVPLGATVWSAGTHSHASTAHKGRESLSG